MENEDQLAAVLAHEMTHSLQRHALRYFRKYRDQQAIMPSISGYASELEAEADRMGIEMMSAAGYDPRKALFLFDQMNAEIEQEGLEEPFFFRGHPTIGQRVENLQNFPDHVYLNIRPAIKKRDIFLADLAQLFLDNAAMDIRLGRFQAAGRGIDKFLQIHPDDSRAYFLRGEIYRQAGRASEIQHALKSYDRAIALNPNYAAAHKAIGLIHFKQGHHALARKYFESCLQLSPDAQDKAYIQGYLRQCTLSEEG